ncbi:MAG: hypothetical protein RLZZ584_4561, partial [Pseudomonadota bacterium]
GHARRDEARRAVARMAVAVRRYARNFAIARVQDQVWAGAAALLQGRQARALACWTRAVHLAGQSQVPIDLPIAQRWLARGLDPQDPQRQLALSAATAGFERLGLRWAAAEARAAADTPS